MPRERDVNLNVRVGVKERAKLRELADDRDLSVSVLVRHMVREEYARAFGTRRRPKPTQTTKGARR